MVGGSTARCDARCGKVLGLGNTEQAMGGAMLDFKTVSRRLRRLRETMSPEAKREMDEACRGLLEAFKDRPPKPVQAFIRYDIALNEHGEVCWVRDEIDRLIDGALGE